MEAIYNFFCPSRRDSKAKSKLEPAFVSGLIQRSLENVPRGCVNLIFLNELVALMKGRNIDDCVECLKYLFPVIASRVPRIAEGGLIIVETLEENLDISFATALASDSAAQQWSEIVLRKEQDIAVRNRLVEDLVLWVEHWSITVGNQDSQFLNLPALCCYLYYRGITLPSFWKSEYATLTVKQQKNFDKMINRSYSRNSNKLSLLGIEGRPGADGDVDFRFPPPMRAEHILTSPNPLSIYHIRENAEMRSDSIVDGNNRTRAYAMDLDGDIIPDCMLLATSFEKKRMISELTALLLSFWRLTPEYCPRCIVSPLVLQGQGGSFSNPRQPREVNTRVINDDDEDLVGLETRAVDVNVRTFGPPAGISEGLIIADSYQVESRPLFCVGCHRFWEVEKPPNEVGEEHSSSDSMDGIVLHTEDDNSNGSRASSSDESEIREPGTNIVLNELVSGKGLESAKVTISPTSDINSMNKSINNVKNTDDMNSSERLGGFHRSEFDEKYAILIHNQKQEESLGESHSLASSMTNDTATGSMESHNSTTPMLPRVSEEKPGSENSQISIQPSRRRLLPLKSMQSFSNSFSKGL